MFFALVCACINPKDDNLKREIDAHYLLPEFRVLLCRNHHFIIRQ